MLSNGTKSTGEKKYERKREKSSEIEIWNIYIICSEGVLMQHMET